MAGWPLFTVGDDKQELELEDTEEDFEGVNDLLVSSTDGPMIVAVELGTSTAVAAEDVGCSAACTVFWDQDPVSLVLIHVTAADLYSPRSFCPELLMRLLLFLTLDSSKDTIRALSITRRT